jgi:hypothetical protein
MEVRTRRFGDAEVDDLRNRAFGGLEDNDVRGLEVAMNDAVLMNVLQSITEFCEERQTICNRKCVAIRVGSELFALDEFENDIWLTLFALRNFKYLFS